MKKVLLIGNPNVGKTAILNRLSHSSYNIGNWAGVTVTRQESTITIGKNVIQILDTPGLYSLNPTSEDEIVSSNIIFSEEYDLIINVIDIHNIQQHFLLTLELAELGIPMIGVLNFYDEFSKSNNMDFEKLQNLVEYPIFPISAKTGYGFETLEKYLGLTANYHDWIPKKTICSQPEYKDLFSDLEDLFIRYPFAGFASKINKYFIATQIYNENKFMLNKFATNTDQVQQLIKKKLPNFYDQLIDKKNHLFDQISIKKLKNTKSVIEISQLIDRVILHHAWGYLFFIGFISVLFTMVFNSSTPLIDFIDWLINEKLYSYIQILISGTAPEIQSFILDGIIRGVGSILSFVPLIFILYIFLAFVEESGYLSRIAFLLEYPLSKIGLSGKSFFPLMLGLGCTVPAIYGTKILETPKLRRITAIVSSLISCGARLPVYALFVAAFFPKNGGVIMLSIYLTGMIFVILLAYILSRLLNNNNMENHNFILLLPPYRIPNISVVLKIASFHAHGYIKKASGLILGLLMIIWCFSYFPEKGDVSKSYLAKTGLAIQPFFEPLGFGDRWEIVVSIIPSLVAKEAVVGFLGQILPSEEENLAITTPEHENKLSITNEILEISKELIKSIKNSFIGLISWNVFANFSPPDTDSLEEEGGQGIITRLQTIWQGDPLAQKKAYSFLLFVLLTLPCVTAIAALKHQLELSYFLLAIGIYIVLPFLFSFLFYQVSLFF
ncbi:MAG: ferrous iron transport protein B [Brevinema sp.]